MSLRGIKAYQKSNVKQDVSTADPHKLTLMLLQGAMDRVAYAKGAIERKDFVNKSKFVTKATSIVIYLRDTLDMEVGGEVAENLKNISNSKKQKSPTNKTKQPLHTQQKNRQPHPNKANNSTPTP